MMKIVAIEFSVFHKSSSLFPAVTVEKTTSLKILSMPYNLIMDRVIIVGTTGSGKSTVAKKLATKLAVKYIQLDLLFWGPNWTESTDTAFFKKINEAVQDSRWVLDGNYNRTQHLTWTKADTVIWIDYPFWLTFFQNLRRAITRSITQEELWPNTGNRESFMRLFSKDSILRWLFKTYDLNRKKYLAKMQDPAFSHITFIHLKSRREVRDFFKNLQ